VPTLAEMLVANNRPLPKPHQRVLVCAEGPPGRTGNIAVMPPVNSVITRALRGYAAWARRASLAGLSGRGLARGRIRLAFHAHRAAEFC
jgi:hypothetical protein